MNAGALNGATQKEERFASLGDHFENIKQGFKINWLTMGDAETGEVLWKSEDCSNYHDSEEEMTATIPKKILKTKVSYREINFSSEEKIDRLKLTQYVYFQDQIAETFEFKFGFVIPGSTNTWQQTIDAAPEEEMIPPESLSGNLVVVTKFFDDDKFICSSAFRIHYV